MWREVWGFLLSLRRYQWHCLRCEVCSYNVAKKSAMTLVAGPTNSGCSGNGIQPSQRMEIMNQVHGQGSSHLELDITDTRGKYGIKT